MSKILITGASSGIGKALAINLGQKGHTLGLAARRLGKLEEVANLVEKAAGKTQIYPLDVRDRQSRIDASDKVQFVAQPISLGLYAYTKNYPKFSLNLHPQLSRIHGLELAGDYLQGASIKACFQSGLESVERLLKTNKLQVKNEIKVHSVSV